VKIPKPKEAEGSEVEDAPKKTEIALPQTLVRIPTEHAPALQAQAGAGGNSEA